MYKNFPSGSTGPSKKQESTSFSDFIGAQMNAALNEEASSYETQLEERYTSLENLTEKPFETAENELPLTQVQEFVALFEERKKTALDDLAYIKKTAENLITAVQKKAEFNEISPKKKLKLAIALSDAEPLTKYEKLKFIEIEKALSNTSIVSAMPTQTINYQLGLLGKTREDGTLSESLFYLLTTIRIDHAPDSYLYKEINNSFLKATPIEICMSANYALINNDNYKVCYEKFSKRLEGIELETLVSYAESVFERKINWRETTRITSTAEVLSALETLPKLEVSEPTKLENYTYGEKKLKEKLVSLYRFIGNEREILLDAIPEYNKNKVILDKLLPTNFEKLIHATLTTKVELPIATQNHFRRRFIIRMNKNTSEAYHKLSQQQEEKYPAVGPEFIVHDLIEKTENELKEYRELVLETKECALEGEALKICYFDSVNKNLEHTFHQKKKAIDEKYKTILKLVKSKATHKIDEIKKNEIKELEVRYKNIETNYKKDEVKADEISKIELKYNKIQKNSDILKLKNDEIESLEIKYNHWKVDINKLKSFVLEQKEKKIMVCSDNLSSFTVENLPVKSVNTIQAATKLLNDKSLFAYKEHTDLSAVSKLFAKTVNVNSPKSPITSTDNKILAR